MVRFQLPIGARLPQRLAETLGDIVGLQQASSCTCALGAYYSCTDVHKTFHLSHRAASGLATSMGTSMDTPISTPTARPPRVLNPAQSRALDLSDRQTQASIAGLILKSSRVMLREKLSMGPPGWPTFTVGQTFVIVAAYRFLSQAPPSYIRYAASCRSQVSFPGEPVRSTYSFQTSPFVFPA